MELREDALILAGYVMGVDKDLPSHISASVNRILNREGLISAPPRKILPPHLEDNHEEITKALTGIDIANIPPLNPPPKNSKMPCRADTAKSDAKSDATGDRPASSGWSPERRAEASERMRRRRAEGFNPRASKNNAAAISGEESPTRRHKAAQKPSRGGILPRRKANGHPPPDMDALPGELTSR